MKSVSSWTPTAWPHTAAVAVCFILAAIQASAKDYSIPLSYSESADGFTHVSFASESRSTPFRKEPACPSGQWERGSLHLAGSPALPIGYLWETKGALHLDLNRNEDLSDDGAAHKPQHCFTGGSYTYCSYTNVHWPSGTNKASKPLLLDLTLNRRNQQTSAYGRLKSFWAAKLELGEQVWQIGIAPTPGQPLKPKRIEMLLRPWDRRDLGFSLDNQDPVDFSLPENLYVAGKWLRVTLEPDSSESTGGVLKLTEQPVILGDLTIAGEHIRQVSLQSSNSAVVIADRAGSVKVPLGTYWLCQAELGVGEVRAFRKEGRRGPPTIVAVGAPSILRIGGPLTNTVTANKHGAFLRLDYKLAGAEGAEYALSGPNRGEPPSFAIYQDQGDQKAGSGKFEYG